jgi:hypothetical protein
MRAVVTCTEGQNVSHKQTAELQYSLYTWNWQFGWLVTRGEDVQVTDVASYNHRKEEAIWLSPGT